MTGPERIFAAAKPGARLAIGNAPEGHDAYVLGNLLRAGGAGEILHVSRDDGRMARLQAALESARRGRTTFVIAHRLSTIRNADVILVFERGRIVEVGGYEELIGRGGAFARLAGGQISLEPAPAG